MTVTLVSILVFCASTTISSGVYRGATVAMILAVLGAVVRAVALTHVAEHEIRSAVPAAPAQARDPLTQRELEVIRMAAAGVETRAAAVARAAARGLLDP